MKYLIEYTRVNPENYELDLSCYYWSGAKTIEGLKKEVEELSLKYMCDVVITQVKTVKSWTINYKE